MSEETAKALAEAMNRLAAAIEALPRDLMGIKVDHCGRLEYSTTLQDILYMGPRNNPSYWSCIWRE